MKRSFLLALALLLAACAAPAASLSSYTLPNPVEVTFSALLPANTPPGETIYLVLLDEVTGLDLNTEPVQMHSIGEQSVSIKLSVPAGSLLKYRYMRQTGNGSFGEVSSGGLGIDYRAFYVDGPGHIAHDMISAWSDLPLSEDTGEITGTLTGPDGAPLANMVVVAAGLQTRTDADGSFVLPGLPQGLHNVLAYSPSGRQRTFQQGALVAAKNETPVNVQIAASEYATVTFWLTPPADHTADAGVLDR